MPIIFSQQKKSERVEEVMSFWQHNLVKFLFIILTFVSSLVFAEDFSCVDYFNSLNLPLEKGWTELLCPGLEQLEGCVSSKGLPIHHFNKKVDHPDGKRILAIGTFHGDEPEAARVVFSWMERLTRIDPRNSWRVIPVMNPDGVKLKSRLNANGIDLNRNFPTKDWQGNALEYWKTQTKSNPRRFPGEVAASESETKCAVKHIDDFKPDFVVAVHTPYGMLDFDGPSIDFPPYKNLPWKRLGNFPGSLGRYLWVDQNVPVLTIELGAGKKSILKIEDMDHLQDITGLVALKSSLVLKRPIAKK